MPIDRQSNRIQPATFGELQPGDYFYSPEGTLCKKADAEKATFCEADTAYAAGDSANFATFEAIEFVPMAPNTH